MDIDEIKKLLAAGDVAGAEASAKAALENDPDNVRLLIVFGTCRQLQGDEEAFLGTYELVRAALDEKKVELDATAAEEWKRFEALHERIAQPELLQKGDKPRSQILMEWVIIAVLVAAGIAVAVFYFGRSVDWSAGIVGPQEMIRPADIPSLYAGPRIDPVNVQKLYAGPRYERLEIQKQVSSDAKKIICTPKEDAADIK